MVTLFGRFFLPNPTCHKSNPKGTCVKISKDLDYIL